MSGMFSDALAFNQNISSWDVSKVTYMSGMFYNAKDFNQDISIWDVSNVTSFRSMFQDAGVFNQDLSKWNIVILRHDGSQTDTEDMFDGAEYQTRCPNFLQNSLTTQIDYDALSDSKCDDGTTPTE